MTSEKTPLDRQTMCNRLAMEFQDGWVVNLGVGMPTLCSNYNFGDTDILFQSENGVIGYGPLAEEGEEDIHLVNAGGQHVTLQQGAAIIHHADSFSLIRCPRNNPMAKGVFVSVYRSNLKLRKQRIFKSRIVNKVKGKKAIKPYKKFKLIIQAFNNKSKKEILT